MIMFIIWRDYNSNLLQIIEQLNRINDVLVSVTVIIARTFKELKLSERYKD